jgi:hypothetical protein
MSEESPPPGGGSNLPARRLTSQELEAVIRRAVELQAASGASDEGIAEAEVVRIGQELGLDPAHVRRAVADVRSRPPAEQGAMASVMGPGRVRAARTVRRPAAEVGRLLEQYLVRCEYMHVQRRFPDRTRYVRDSSIAAGFGRLARQFGTRDPRLELKEVDVAVSAVDAGTALVEVSLDLTSERAGYFAGGVAAGTVTSVPPVVFSLATAAPDLLALTAVPLFGAWLLGMRAGYRYSAKQGHEKLESFLDRLEHGELKVPQGSEWTDALKRLKPPRF